MIVSEDKKNEDSTGKRSFEWAPSPNGLFETYSNYTHTSWSLFDVRVLFGQIKPDKGNSGNFVAEERAAITVAWPEAKQLIIGLSALIDSYEKTNGEIKPLRLTPRPE